MVVPNSGFSKISITSSSTGSGSSIFDSISLKENVPSTASASSMRFNNSSDRLLFPSVTSIELMEAGDLSIVISPVSGSYVYAAPSTGRPFTSTFKLSGSIPSSTWMSVCKEKIFWSYAESSTSSLNSSTEMECTWDVMSSVSDSPAPLPILLKTCINWTCKLSRIFCAPSSLYNSFGMYRRPVFSS